MISVRIRTRTGTQVRKIDSRSAGVDVGNRINAGITEIAMGRASDTIHGLGADAAVGISKYVDQEISTLSGGLFDRIIGHKTDGQATRLSVIDFLGGENLSLSKFVSGADEIPGYSRAVGGLGPTYSLKSGGIEWSGYTKKYRRRKRSDLKGKGNYNKFFARKGNLKGQLRKGLSASTFKAKTGGVIVSFTPKKNLKPIGSRGAGKRKDVEAQLGQIEIQLLPKITRKMLPYLNTGNWSDVDSEGGLEKLLFGPKTNRKLRNPKGEMRHLVQPLISSMLAFRVPRAVARGVRKATKLQGKRNK